MYLDYFGLKEAPFSITPDPRYVFLSDRHREALAHLLYGVGKGGGSGFVQLTGEVGTGKTTLCRLLLEQLPEDTHFALILNPKLSPLELLQAACEELGVETVNRQWGQKDYVDALNHYLLDAYAQGLRVVLIVDEAQELSVEALEQIRLLTNLETPTQKLLQIILLGQPELRELLARSELRQLAQRITARYHLQPLDCDETAAYVRHRLEVAGLSSNPFSRLGLLALHKRSGGIPRVINIVADRAMTAGFALDKRKLGERLVQRAADEALPGHMRHWWRKWRILGLSCILVLALLAGVLWWQVDDKQPSTDVALPAPATSVVEAPFNDALLHSASGPEQWSAWAALLARWQVTSSEADIAEARKCAPVIAPGLHCLRGSGSLQQISQFNRPVLLLLRSDADNTSQEALLLGIGTNHVRLRVNGENHELPKDDLAAYWDGNFIALFRVPKEVPLVLQKGAAGPAVAWVADQVALLDDGTQTRSGPTYYDGVLEARIRRLQQGFGLRADGIVGQETLFALASLSETGPHLAHGVP